MSNLILNPKFEINLNNWTESGTPVEATIRVENSSEFISPNQNPSTGATTSVKIRGGSGYRFQYIFSPSASLLYLRYSVRLKYTSYNTPYLGIYLTDVSETNWYYGNSFNNTHPQAWQTYTSSVSGLNTSNDHKFIITTSDPNSSGDYWYVTDIYVGTSSNYCFNKGTKILSLRDGIEMYIPIEELDKEKDLVKTYLNGFKKISGVKHMILNNNPEDFTSCMYIMEKQRDMIDDLVVSGGHSILEDSYESTEAEKMHKELFGGEIEKIDNKVLVLAGKSSKFRQIKNKEIFDIYHIALEGENDKNEDKRYGIWANGVLTESTYKKVLYKSLNLF